MPLTVAAGPGNIPTNETQQVTVRANAGQFKLAFSSPKPGSTTISTPNLNFGASAAEVQSALEGITTIGAGNVAVSEGPGDETGSTPYLIEFKGRYADVNVRRLSPTNVSLSGGSPSTSVTVATPQEGGGVVETCTTACGLAIGEENSFETGQGVAGSAPGQFRNNGEIAVDNDPASPSYGDVYVVDEGNYRIQKYSPSGQFLLMFGGEVDKTTGADVCTAADLAGGDICGVGVPGNGPGHFHNEAGKNWGNQQNNSIAVGPTGTVYVGDYGRIQEFEPDGAFAGEFVLPDGEPLFVIALAVDPAGNIYERSANLSGSNGSVVQEAPGIREYDSSHSFVRSFDTQAGSEPTHIALNEEGDLFVSDRNGGGGNFEFRGFEPDGVPLRSLSFRPGLQLPATTRGASRSATRRKRSTHRRSNPKAPTSR